jgi:tetratricopeptide (TPR) repeat protein
LQRPVLVLVFAFLLVPACRRSAPDALPEPALSLLRVAEDLGDPDPAATQEAPQRLRAFAATAAATSLGAALFDRATFTREVDDKDLRYVLLPSVLANHRGSCVGLGSLYLAAAPLVAREARGVLVPGHFYVQVKEGARWRNVELLRRGEEMPDEWYRQRYGAPGGEVAGRPLTTAEVVGVVAFDVGNERRRQGRLGAARRAYERAVAEFPAYAQAHASLGMTLQLLGALDEAAAAYAQAGRLDPALPGLAHNVQLLERERAARAAPALTPAAAGTAEPEGPVRRGPRPSPPRP